MMATWKDDIVAALGALGGSAAYADIYEEVARRRTSLPKSWRFIIRRTIQDHSSDSAGYKGREDLFVAVRGLHAGEWGLR
ncbi:hypothetical protein CGZ98_16600 [Enemella evansiae]|nr:hypothetical protein CGZ98_16600 [Enemella evansiae]